MPTFVNSAVLAMWLDGPFMIPSGQFPDVLPKFAVWVSALVAMIGIAQALFSQVKQNKKSAEQQYVRIIHLEKKAEEEPEKVRFAWDLARVKLEAYFDRNLNQVKAIFYVAIGVMAAGFAFIVWGIHAAVESPERVKIALIASASGIITEFIGVTFMVIYRSTMLQATQFMSVLERINTVGMAVQILDAMDEGSPNLKDQTRVDIIRLLLAPTAHVSLSQRPETESPKTKGASA
jgi:hypothetical protein